MQIFKRAQFQSFTTEFYFAKIVLFIMLSWGHPQTYLDFNLNQLGLPMEIMR